ncbi:MAG: DUF6065 family protein [Vicinamibacterales bacterium]
MTKKSDEAPRTVETDAQPVFTAYRLHHAPLALASAPGQRDWMDATDQRYAYRCLPLLIANQAGWWVLNDQPLDVFWDGSKELTGVRIRRVDPNAPPASITSHFGEGIVTFHIPYLFRTPPGYNLLVRGPANMPKDGIQALEGLVESDWSTATFTMNWKITRRRRWIRFEKDEPICMLVPQRRGELEGFQTDIRDLSSNPELHTAHRQWADSRSKFLTGLKTGDRDAVDKRWQKDYFQGRTPGAQGGREHQTVLHLQPFEAKPKNEQT